MLACLKTPQTYHLIGRDELAVSPAVASSTKTLGEPPPPGSPHWGLPNLIFTPHQAGVSQHRKRKPFEFFCENLDHYLKGEPLRNVVDKKRGF